MACAARTTGNEEGLCACITKLVWNRRPFCVPQREESDNEQSWEESDEGSQEESDEDTRRPRTLQIEEPVQPFCHRTKEEEDYKKERENRVSEGQKKDEDDWDAPREPPPESDVPELVLDDPANDAEEPTMEDWMYDEGKFEETTY